MNRQFLARLLLIMAISMLNGCGGRPPEQPSEQPESDGLSQKLQQRIDQEGKKLNIKPTKYAILINGAPEIRFEAELSLAYQILLENRFKRENIYVLGPYQHDSFLYPIDATATKMNLEAIFNHLKKRVSNKDLLFVFVSDHGNRIQETVLETNKSIYTITVSTINLVDYELDQKEFARYFEDIKPRIGIFLFGQCYGGGFAQEIGRKNFVAIAVTKANSPSFIEAYDYSFLGYFMLAFRDKGVDANKDGKVNLEEAFKYAKQKESYSKQGKQEPFIQSEINPAQIFLNQ